MASRGFTLVELVTVMILIGILAVVALPNLDQSQGFGATSFRDRVAASLRFAQKSAVAKRRMVCATITPGALTLTSATGFGDANCPNAMPGPDGSNPAAVSPGAGVVLGVIPAGVLYFQPSGRLTSNAAGTAPVTVSVTVTGQAPIGIRGNTGYVD
jgi:prepilin-type N-terminal cleavage/methylation domain-containing protein